MFYLDDILILGGTSQEASKHRDFVTNWLNLLGFTLNHPKCQPVAAMKYNYSDGRPNKRKTKRHCSVSNATATVKETTVGQAVDAANRQSDIRGHSCTPGTFTQTSHTKCPVKSVQKPGGFVSPSASGSGRQATVTVVVTPTVHDQTAPCSMPQSDIDNRCVHDGMGCQPRGTECLGPLEFSRESTTYKPLGNESSAVGTSVVRGRNNWLDSEFTSGQSISGRLSEQRGRHQVGQSIKLGYRDTVMVQLPNDNHQNIVRSRLCQPTGRCSITQQDPGRMAPVSHSGEKNLQEDGTATSRLVRVLPH